MLKRIKRTYKRKYTRKEQDFLFDKGNCFLSESEDKRRRKRLSYFILILAGLLVIIPSLFLLKTRIEQNMFVDSEQEVLKEQKSVSMVMSFYLHQQAYVDYCKSLGVSFNNYPDRFSDRFQKEYVLLNDYLIQKRGFGLDQAYIRLKNKFETAILKSVKTNFDKMAYELKSYHKDGLEMTHQDVCLLLDENADEIIQVYRHHDYLNIQNISKILIVD